MASPLSIVPVSPALKGLLSVFALYRTIRRALSPMSATANRSVTPDLSSKFVLNTVIKMRKNEFCLNFYTGVRNTNSVIKNEDNYLSQRNYYVAQEGLNPNSYRNAGINLLSTKQNADWARPGIGFEREGLEGAFFYYEDGQFRFLDHKGVVHYITSTL